MSGVEGDMIRQRLVSASPSSVPGTVITVELEFMKDYIDHAHAELEVARACVESSIMVLERGCILAGRVSSLTRDLRSCTPAERRNAGLGTPGSLMQVEKLISLPSIRNDLSWIIYESHVTRALRVAWERDRYHTIVASDSKTWIAAKKTTMTLETRVRFIDGLRGVKDAIKVTAESLAAGKAFRDAAYLIWIPFTGNKTEVHKCVEEGFRPIRNTGRVTFYLDGAERFRRGGAMAMEDAD